MFGNFCCLVCVISQDDRTVLRPEEILLREHEKHGFWGHVGAPRRPLSLTQFGSDAVSTSNFIWFEVLAIMLAGVLALITWYSAGAGAVCSTLSNGCRVESACHRSQIS